MAILQSNISGSIEGNVSPSVQQKFAVDSLVTRGFEVKGCSEFGSLKENIRDKNGWEIQHSPRDLPQIPPPENLPLDLRHALTIAPPHLTTLPRPGMTHQHPPGTGS